MKAIRGIYQNGQFKLLEPVPDVSGTPVLIVFPDAAERKRPSPTFRSEAEMFGCGKDWWTDEVDAAVRESFVVLPRPWEQETPNEDTNAAL